MRKEKTSISPYSLLPNTGQLDWLPRNPRQWTQEDVDKTSRSIAEDPDFLEDRPVLVVPSGNGKYLVFAGNLRLTAAKSIALASVPVVIYTPETDTDRETIKRRALKDNGSFGAWDWDILANEWEGPFNDWGIPAWEMEKNDTPPQEGEAAPERLPDEGYGNLAESFHEDREMARTEGGLE